MRSKLQPSESGSRRTAEETHISPVSTGTTCSSNKALFPNQKIIFGHERYLVHCTSPEPRHLTFVLFFFDPFIRVSPVGTNGELVQDLDGVLIQPCDDIVRHLDLCIESALQRQQSCPLLIIHHLLRPLCNTMIQWIVFLQRFNDRRITSKPSPVLFL